MPVFRHIAWISPSRRHQPRKGATRTLRFALGAAALGSAFAGPSSYAAEPTVTAAAAAAPAPATAPTPPPPPYALPWQLRGVVPGTVLRTDNSFAFYEDPATGTKGRTGVSLLFASYKLTPEIAPLFRMGYVQNLQPGPTNPDGSSFLNPIVGGIYSKKLGAFRIAPFVGLALPLGTGSGDTPDAGTNNANAAGIKARSGMDNAMFAVNYLTMIGGLGFAYIDHGVTLQVEGTLFQLIRTRGDNAKSAHENTRTNSTMGFFAGYAPTKWLSLGGELRYQHWLSSIHKFAAATKTYVDISDAEKDTFTFAVGPRFTFKAAGLTFRPGISYARAIDEPLKTASYNTMQIDLPVIF
jgi:hypothetical protein